jgi:hypothetical protein
MRTPIRTEGDARREEEEGGLLTIRRAKSTTRTLKNRGLLGSSIETKQRRQPGLGNQVGGEAGDGNGTEPSSWLVVLLICLFGRWWVKLLKSRRVNEQIDGT